MSAEDSRVITDRTSPGPEWAVKYAASVVRYRSMWMRRARQYKRRGGSLSAYMVKACAHNARANNRDLVWVIRYAREHC